jgi:hypothetical protein
VSFDWLKLQSPLPNFADLGATSAQLKRRKLRSGITQA